MKKKKRVSIGIAAYNEQKNIAVLLSALLSQKATSYVLQKIYVISDGSIDATPDIVKDYKKVSKKIEFTEGRKREGKNFRLNQLFRKNKSDILVLFDADVILREKTVIEKLVQGFNDDQVEIVAGRDIPAQPHTFIEKLAVTWVEIWDTAKYKVNNGNNVNCLSARIFAVSKRITKSVIYPKTIVDDQFLYFECKKRNYKFNLQKNAVVEYKVPQNFYDYLTQSARYVNLKKAVVDYFGGWVEENYYISWKLKIKSILSVFYKYPAYVVMSVVLQQIVRLLVIFKNNEVGKSTWKTNISTK